MSMKRNQKVDYMPTGILEGMAQRGLTPVRGGGFKDKAGKFYPRWEDAPVDHEVVIGDMSDAT